MSPDMPDRRGAEAPAFGRGQLPAAAQEGEEIRQGDDVGDEQGGRDAEQAQQVRERPDERGEGPERQAFRQNARAPVAGATEPIDDDLAQRQRQIRQEEHEAQADRIGVGVAEQERQEPGAQHQQDGGADGQQQRDVAQRLAHDPPLRREVPGLGEARQEQNVEGAGDQVQSGGRKRQRHDIEAEARVVPEGDDDEPVGHREQHREQRGAVEAGAESQQPARFGQRRPRAKRLTVLVQTQRAR